MIPMLLMAVALLSSPAEGSHNATRVLRKGQFTTDRALCPSAACVPIKNLSETECIAIGFAGGGLDEHLPFTMVVDGQGAKIGVWTWDGPNIVFVSCVPPDQTVYGIVDDGRYTVQSIAFRTGDSWYWDFFDGDDVLIYGEKYTDTDEVIPVRGRQCRNQTYVFPGPQITVGGQSCRP